LPDVETRYWVLGTVLFPCANYFSSFLLTFHWHLF
jgi:hypothetical protein